MTKVHFTKNIQRHVECPPIEVTGETVREVLDAYFATNERARGYVLDEIGNVRKNIAVFLDGECIVDREKLSDKVSSNSEIYVMQALSGG